MMTMTPLILLLFLNSVSTKLFGLRGPGLNPTEIILPCRYFFVDAHNDSHLETNDLLHVSIAGKDKNGRICKAWTQTFDLPSGSHLVRYKFHSTCYDVILNVRYGPDHVSGSPLHFDHVTPDTCHTCSDRRKSLEKWVDSTNCPTPTSQMDLDLAKFGMVDMEEAVARTKKMFNQPGVQCWCHYAVKDGEVYRKCYGQHIGFSMFWDNILGWLNRRAILPDLEMLVNLGDWPLVKNTIKPPLPMFSWCGSSSTQDMVFPTYDLTEASLECMGRQSLDVLSSMGTNQVPWEEKSDQLFWRGRDSRRERINLVEMSHKNPKIINASITAFFFFREEEKRLGKAPHVSFFDFFNHKYQLNVDGTVAAYRFPYLLAGSGVVFKQKSDYYEHFYSDLEPMVHYIPVKSDLSDLVEKVIWAKENQDQVKQISKNGRQFAVENLMPHNVLCYHAQLLVRWSKMMKNSVKISEGMEKVNLENSEKYGNCHCEERSRHKDEL